MLYAIISTDVENSLPLRKTVRTKHLERIQQLQDQGRLFVAGPHPAVDSEDPGDNGFTGSLIIAEFKSLDEAKQWADDDPYIEAGVYSNVIVKPFKKVMP